MPAVAIGMAAQQTPHGQIRAANEAMLLDRLNGIIRAVRFEAANISEKWGDADFVCAMQGANR